MTSRAKGIRWASEEMGIRLRLPLPRLSSDDGNRLVVGRVSEPRSPTMTFLPVAFWILAPLLKRGLGTPSCSWRIIAM